jgi:hypothetical protein
MLRSRGPVCAVVCAVVCLGALWVAAARADETSAVEDIVAVLREKGLIDQATGDEILAKQAKTAAAPDAKATPPVAQGLLDGFIFSGDLRLRDEQYWYNHGLQGTDANDNNRFRYRARFGFTKQINDWSLVGVRLVSATGTGDGVNRSTNISAGETSDFSYDPIWFDRLYAQVTLPDPGIGLTTTLTGGKMTNPFIWKIGLDKMLWDDDIAPEGVQMSSTYPLAENAKLWANLAYYVELQNANQVDPRVYASQVGGSIKLPGAVEIGARGSFYDWRHLANDATVTGHTGYFDRSRAKGNLANGFDPDMRIIESSGYVTWSGLEGWPATLWGTWLQNVAADGGVVNGVRIGANDQAFGVGGEIGDAKRWARVGLAYQHVEANAVPALYTDSDMFDGLTNREGFALYGFREIMTNTELRLWLWDSHPIKTTASGAGGGPFNISGATDSQANRLRLQTDLNFKF